MMKKVWLVLLAVVLVFGLIVSCGGGDDSSKTPIVEDPLPPVDPTVIKGFLEGLAGFESFVKELNKFEDGGPGTTIWDDSTKPNQFAQWKFDVADLAEADYFVFATDGSITKTYGSTEYGAKKDGFGGTQVGLQNQGGSYGMSDNKITTEDWTTFDRSGICFFVVKVSELPDPGTNSGGFVAVSEGDLRIFVGYFSDGNICGLAPNGYAALVKGSLTKPDADAIDIKNKTPSKVVGFCAKVPE